MKIKKTIVLLSFFLLLSCGFEPIYSEKNLKKYNFTITSIGFEGNYRVNQKLKNNLTKYTGENENQINFDLNINSKLEKKIKSKDKQGDPLGLLLKIIAEVKIFKDNELRDTRIFVESFEYQNKSNKIELNQYEESLQNNLTIKLSEEIVRHLYFIK